MTGVDARADWVHFGFTGCHNTELQTHTQRAVTSNDDTAPKVENTGWLILTADFGAKMTSVRNDPAHEYLRPFCNNLENFYVCRARNVGLRFAFIAHIRREVAWASKKRAGLLRV